ncbi:DctP family TRAP transporter solute-binding subunit [Ponticoccus alexandrii]|uniref:DctP family TRAP transporter solute-binding subunit n=1 Tax=Ponticoccus alexandrii TaxID=1943633 RepID=A0ABX7FH79_9RHOB|nr:DctP family TRAP transporter solute-binding subunit [Ponticoccus alexandrii]ETA53158.1 ABC transporter substrate-binding protein [Rhodobacteraceae bacterium PD-2]QRF68772.1 DctP family TRAP transporter solute-binding subunit [Ponticoccus alexandrii]
MKLIHGLLAAALLATGAQAQDYSNRTIKFAATGQEGTPPVQGMHIFAEKLEEQSDGKLKVRVFANGVLGGDVQVLSSLQGGVVEMMVWNAGNMITQAQDFGILDLPFIYQDEEVLDTLLDGDVGKMLTDQLPEHGVIGLSFWEQGFRQLTNNAREVHRLEDIEGLKIRVQQNPLLVDMWEALGANPTPMAVTELYTALETGAVDGQETTAPFILGSKYHEVQDYLSVTRHNYNPQIVLIGKPLWDQLSDDEKALIQKVAQETAVEQRRISREAQDTALAEIRASGNVVTEIAPEELERMQEAVAPVIREWAGSFDPELTSTVFDAVGFSLD